ncbi:MULTISPECIES: GntR family transcriptional regulator [unclassified Bosea (in: a-proteobacteria)]|uniref:GntR family transcriptional regulator n=1 Tax=unclassified Bosea (in: a-proteobacteria) TaxID=2653178 RepID=UPI000954DB56|nr:MULTISPECIES: GntR family transcriptional regulator [unclassified Bosea (in: a-proteobacteria)]TAJ33292.1 MAG: GntR family transcriptional regulator [Bosea sp. (in: a-proteobacteria)]SIQ45953.1 GntR family transcriptional regulator [Bosea sp. TND4EK4]
MPEAAKARKPIYVEVQDYVLDLINGPDYGPGDRIPSERALADTLGFNRMTVRKAIDRLVERNVLERNGTSGTRVPLVQVTRPIEVRSTLGITRLIRNAGGNPGTRLLHFAEEPASPSVAQRLCVAPGTALVMFRRLRSVNDEPFCIETSWLPAERVPSLVAEDLIAGQSLYDLLRERYRLTVTADQREISVGTATELEARQLALKTGAPTLVLRLVAHDADGRPIEYMKSVNHPHHVVFRSSGGGDGRTAEAGTERGTD